LNSDDSFVDERAKAVVTSMGKRLPAAFTKRLKTGAIAPRK
jgi:hypothetical protein